MIKIGEEFKESAKYYYSEEDIEKGFVFVKHLVQLVLMAE